MRPLSPRLPLDVQLMILDAVPGVPHEWPAKYESLLSCALTCQDWLPRARRYLYNTIEFDDQYQFPLLSRTLSESPSLGALIQTLDFACLSSQGLAGTPEERLEYVPFTTEAVSTLSSLRSLAFRVLPNDNAPAFFVNLARSFNVLSTLESLTFQNVVFTAISNKSIVHVVWSFPALKTIELNGCHIWFGEAGTLPDPNAHRDRLRTLRTLKVRVLCAMAGYSCIFLQARLYQAPICV